MLGAIVISMVGFPQESLLFMAGKQRIFLVMQTVASVSYIILLIVLSHFFGVIGAAWAYFGGQALDVLTSFFPTMRAYFQRKQLKFKGASESSS